MSDPIQDQFPNIHPGKTYRRVSMGRVFTGQQVLNALELAGADAQARILLDLQPTDAPADDPASHYGLTR